MKSSFFYFIGFCHIFSLSNLQSFANNIGRIVISEEKAVTKSETLTEHTTGSCTTIASNNCGLLDLDLWSY